MEIVGAGLVIENDKGEVLVLHRNENVPEGNKYGFPGGKVAEGQKPIEAAKLKTYQEVGLEFNDDSLNFLGEFKFIVDDNKVTYSAWTTKFSGDQKAIKLNTDGHDEFKWDKPETLLKRDDLMVGVYPIIERFVVRK